MKDYLKHQKKERLTGIKRLENQGKGLDGVFKKHEDYQNPLLSMLLTQLKGAK